MHTEKTSLFCAYNKATWPSGKARVCNTLITGSNPVRASKAQKFFLGFFYVIEIAISYNVKRSARMRPVWRCSSVSIRFYCRKIIAGYLWWDKNRIVLRFFLCHRKDLVTLKRESPFLWHKKHFVHRCARMRDEFFCFAKRIRREKSVFLDTL